MKQMLFSPISLNDLKSLIGEVIEEKVSSIPQPPPLNNLKYLTRKDVAYKLNISLPTLNEWTKQGILQSYRIGSRVLYKEDEVAKALNETYNQKKLRKG